MNRRSWICTIAVAMVACSAMGRGVLNEFVVWDDPATIYENPLLHPPALDNVMRFWLAPAGGLYVPVTYTAWALIAKISASAWLFHLVSVLVHACASVLVFFILLKIVGNNIAACLGAMMFAAHPLQVEAVAWASGLKDLLAAMFALAAICLHLSRSLRSHIVAAILFLIAMLAKPSAASAILIAVILDILLRNKSALKLWPWVLIAIPLLIVARMVQDTPMVPHVEIWRRAFVAGDAIAFYLMKLFAPIRLSIDYGRTPDIALASKWTVMMPIVVIAFASRSRILLASILIMIAGLIWNLGLAPFQFQIHSTVADHYMYLAMVGPALTVAWIVSRWKQTTLIALVAIVTFTALSIRQTFIWRDSETLMRHAINVNPRAIAPHDNLGLLFGKRNDFAGAAEEFRTSLAINPDNPEALKNLAIAELDLGDADGYLGHLERSILLNQSRGVDVTEDIRNLMRVRATRAQTRPSQ